MAVNCLSQTVLPPQIPTCLIHRVSPWNHLGGILKIPGHAGPVDEFVLICKPGVSNPRAQMRWPIGVGLELRA